MSVFGESTLLPSKVKRKRKRKTLVKRRELEHGFTHEIIRMVRVYGGITPAELNELLRRCRPKGDLGEKAWMYLRKYGQLRGESGSE